MDVLVIEDEKIASDSLIKLLEEIDPNIKVSAVLETVSDSISWLQSFSADLIFLDVHLADDISFKIFESIDLTTPIIFTTAYDEYAIRAFKLNSIDYLLKPIDKNELEQSLIKLKTLQGDFKLRIQSLIETFHGKGTSYQKRFSVTSGDRIKSISSSDIAYFFGQDKYVYLTTFENKQYVIDKTLTQLEQMLDPEYFFRINRQFLINFEAIDNMYAYPRGRVKVELKPSSKHESIVSIDRSGSFRKWLNR